MHERAGTPALPDDLIDVAGLLRAYAETTPDLADPAQRVVFGTSGHRGSALTGAFTESHIAAISAAIAEYRAAQGIRGPLFIGADTHPLSAPAERTAVEVLLAADVDVQRAAGAGDAWFVPTPALSHAILRHNRGLSASDPARADGIVVTPSHNPPADGGFKYNPPHGGPADTDATNWIAARANELLALGTGTIPRATGAAVAAAASYDFLGAYVDDLGAVIDVAGIRDAGIRFAAHPLGGASVAYWAAIRDRLGLDVTVLGDGVDPQWGFMHLDWDGKIRMDPSSAHVMSTVDAFRGEFDLITGNDADADRHGIVTADGLMNPNHYLAVAIDYLLTHRPDWPVTAGIGKTLVSSGLIDRVVAAHGRQLLEVPVGFKWFVPGLSDGTVVFGGEESAGASFQRFDGSAWSTDKDGILLALLAAEIQAVTGQSPAQRYRELVARFGEPSYARIDAPAAPAQKARLGVLAPEDVTDTELAGDPITAILTRAPGNDAAIGGLKVQTDHAWFAARPSGTEDVMKIYAESFRGPEHLARVQEAAQALVARVLG
ncbi:phosphoglucomutase (alpha-D-glucose-1,6-bisphosphate-dependent) [Leucobacter chromiireducens]|uniref:Alpha-D-glucose phosphate-specific phosphoglucomutase n=1 Tax=Leucobacter chromiireducens subsp. solipictus TaxID=398235 RepID=A0ABS1SDL4_9MICO|nr:phosphoglucomutase (alpha-D-glucose-1,6-bisphosphate-dependent) [Leucobacter chromiireducens]MBL3678619.1 alpha-D-glucose phosphate-specific phosphoglucomutase [Leucobacter chromiireducens subsp. solipictus]